MEKRRYIIFGSKRAAAWCLLLLALWFSSLASDASALDVPPLTGYVNDYANMISAPARAQLENELKAFEQSDSTQIVILTVPSLQGEVIEEYGIKVAESWKIGQKGKDNGAIFIVARDDRKMRIEVGRGLEGRLTDLTAGRIVDLVVKPRFKRGDFDGGFIAGVSSIIDATRGEFKAEENGPAHKAGGSSRILSMLIFGGLVILVLGSISRAFGGIAGALIFPGIAHMVMPGLAVSVIAAVLGFGAGLLLPSLFSSGGRYRDGGGFWMGGPGLGGGFGGGGGGFGGGGFSGGGGSFGGGGASGDW